MAEANLDEYFSFDVEDLEEGKMRSFPVFLYLKSNNHMIMVSKSGDSEVKKTLSKYASGSSNHLYIPIQFKSAFERYSEPDKDEKIESSYNVLSKEAERVLEILRDESISSEEKTREISLISNQILLDFSKLSKGDPEEAEMMLEKCRTFTEEIVSAAIESFDDKSIYEKIIEIKKQLTANHATSVSTFSVMFAFACNITDLEELSDLSMAALLHDVGNIRTPFSLSRVPEFEIPPEDISIYRDHVKNSIEILEGQNIELNPRIKRIILEHHEKFDGSGFPNGLGGDALHHLSRIHAIADYFDEAMTGRMDGKKRGAFEAIEFLNSIQASDGSIWFDPKFLSRILKLFE